MFRMHPFDFNQILAHKLSRWFSTDMVPIMVGRAVKLIACVHQHVPPCVLFCLLCTWSNAWCTTRRFQESEAHCLLHSECDGEDSVEHYAVCKYQWNVFAAKLHRPNRPKSVCRSFALEEESADDMVFQVCLMYAVKRAVGTLRRERSTATHVYFKLIWQGHRTAALYHEGLAKRYALNNQLARRWKCIRPVGLHLLRASKVRKTRWAAPSKMGLSFFVFYGSILKDWSRVFCFPPQTIGDFKLLKSPLAFLSSLCLIFCWGFFGIHVVALAGHRVHSMGLISFLVACYLHFDNFCCGG